ncbi:hypothetical protein Nepgr_019210 [Nepenthes gracilis]|uniref:Uncharacterized protein n=1 Tax=Nepenthes gracilis TaxID=150966 RepID=A0AAD3XUT2_NEPGR|nr:hypothetical protein Nepgr_019210 [Nepenthes gracilis]
MRETRHSAPAPGGLEAEYGVAGLEWGRQVEQWRYVVEVVERVKGMSGILQKEQVRTSMSRRLTFDELRGAALYVLSRPNSSGRLRFTM